MKIGVVGSGRSRKTLGAGFLKHGHGVTLGTRETGKLADWAAKNPGAEVGDFAAAAAFGEIVVLAVAGAVALDALKLAGAGEHRRQDGDRRLQSDRRRAAGPRRADVLHQPDRFADGAAAKGLSGRAFRQGVQFRRRGANGRPAIRRRQADDVHLRRSRGGQADRAELFDEFGWETADMGALEAARAIEPLCMLWCIPGVARGGWSPHAFKLLRGEVG